MRKSLMTLSALVLALAGSSGLQAQSTGSEKPAKAVRPSTAKAAAKPAASKGQSEGIKVHGHWTIKVSNPDGKVVMSREFENSLDPGSASGPSGGGWALEAILLGVYVPQSYFITLSGTGPNQSPANAPSPCGNQSSQLCEIDESFSAQLGDCTGQNPSIFCTLTRNPGLGSVPANGTVPMTFQGSFTAPLSGYVGSVGFDVFLCLSQSGLSQTSPAACVASPPFQGNLGSGFAELTSTTLSTPVQVTAGQLVSASVTISFQ